MGAAQDERLEYWRLPELAGVEGMHAENSARCWRVYHDAYTVCTVLRGEGGTEWIYRGRLHHTTPGGLMLMEPGEVHANRRVTGPADFDVLLLPAPLVCEAAIELGIHAGSPPHLKLPHVRAEAFFEAFSSFHACLQAPTGRLERESRLVKCLRQLFLRCTERTVASDCPPVGPGLLRARDFIREHHSRSIRLHELAIIAGMNRFQLVRAFAKAFALPPHAYQLGLQLEKARTLLVGGMSCADAALDAGFTDQSHLGRHFTRTYGITPARYASAGPPPAAI